MSASEFFVSGLENDIKDTFYNSIVDYILGFEEASQQNLPSLLQEAIEDTIRRILLASSSIEGIRLLTGRIIREDNCPEKYRAFFNVLLRLKSQSTSNQELINHLIQQILILPSYQELNPTQFILEARGLVEPEKYLDIEGITPDLIRETFYNEMVNQTLIAIDQNWLTVDDLEGQESKVYFALPALTIVAAIQESRECNGILLLNGKVLNQQNCPIDSNFENLVKPILSVKTKISAFSDQQLLEVKKIFAMDSELSTESTTLQSQELRESFTAIKLTAIAISERRVFHEMVTLVINTCLETLGSSSTPSLS